MAAQNWTRESRRTHEDRDQGPCSVQSDLATPRERTRTRPGPRDGPFGATVERIDERREDPVRHGSWIDRESVYDCLMARTLDPVAHRERREAFVETIVS